MVFQIDTIDTEDQAKVFAERLSGPSQIYFLDGVWGSGKSEYLEKVASFLPKNFKFVQLALWKPSNKATLAKKYSWPLTLALQFYPLYWDGS